MVLANHLSHFPSHKESLSIPIAQNIQHMHLSNADLDVIWALCNVSSVQHQLPPDP